MLKLEFENGDINLRSYDKFGYYGSGKHILHAVDVTIQGNIVTFWSDGSNSFTCLKSDIKIIGDLFDIPYVALGDGWLE